MYDRPIIHQPVPACLQSHMCQVVIFGPAGPQFPAAVNRPGFVFPSVQLTFAWMALHYPAISPVDGLDVSWPQVQVGRNGRKPARPSAGGIYVAA